jgi:EAL domain-containing protein (putative c-di-GMP-specific phosphodiesterase class I)
VQHHGLVARAGGDEFVILIDGNPPADLLDNIARQILDALRVPLERDGEICSFGASIGIARNDPTQMHLAATFIDADVALYQAKQDGRHCARHFLPPMRAAAVVRRLSSNDIAHAIKKNEFVNYYQPQFCAQSRRLVGVETLVRWQSPKHGLLTPDSFLTAAKTNGLIAKIDAQVLERALEDQQTWARYTDDLPRVSVNVSMSRLHEPLLLESLKHLAIPPQMVCLELLENTFMESKAEHVFATIRALQARGFAIEVDDFGSGHASIANLFKVAPKRLKVNRTIIDQIVSSQEQRKIVATIVQIAKLSGDEVTAEGIETADHAKIATSLGFDILQGFGLAKPMDNIALCAFLEQYNK